MPITLGIDLGTTKCAAVLCGGEKQFLLDARSVTHEAALPCAEEDAAEQSPEKILAAAEKAVLLLPQEQRKLVSAVGVTGQMHSVLGWNKTRIFPLVTWQDRRCGNSGALAEFCRRSGRRLYDGFGAATLARLGSETDSWKHASTIMDFLVCRLTGADAPCTDPADAASWGIYDFKTGDWDMAAADSLEIPHRLLPEIRPGGSVAGTLSKFSAEWLGLPAGIPVFTATGDNQASILGTGSDWGKELYLTLGTGAQLSAVVSPKEAAMISGAGGRLELRPYFGGRLLAVSACLCGGRAFSWIGETVRNWLADLNLPVPELPGLLDRIDELGMNSSADSGLRTVPSFLGERGEDSLRGEICGITLENFTLGNLAASAAEGILRNLKEPFPEAVLDSRTTLLGSGNGLRRVQCIQRAVRNLFPQKLVLTESREEAACGAARLTKAFQK